MKPWQAAKAALGLAAPSLSDEEWQRIAAAVAAAISAQIEATILEPATLEPAELAAIDDAIAQARTVGDMFYATIAPALEAKFRAGLVNSGMREFRCAKCGCVCFTRDDSDTMCPSCAGAAVRETIKLVL